jgi:hypothetical protein
MRRGKQKNVHRRSAVTAAMLIAGFGFCSSAMVAADDSGPYRSVASMQAAAALDGLEVSKKYALGINRFDLDSQTEILGWRLNDAWYFGRQDGMDSGLTLVWQQETNQVSLSKDGLRLTRRF